MIWQVPVNIQLSVIASSRLTNCEPGLHDNSKLWIRKQIANSVAEQMQKRMPSSTRFPVVGDPLDLNQFMMHGLQ